MTILGFMARVHFWKRKTKLSMNPYHKSLNTIDTVRPEQSVPKLHRDAASKGERRPSTSRPDKASDALLRMSGFMDRVYFRDGKGVSP